MKKYKSLLVTIAFGVVLNIAFFATYAHMQQNGKKHESSFVVSANPGDDYPAIWKDEPINSMVDSWGMGNRQCTSWVSWKLWQTMRVSTSNYGNARDWISTAIARNEKIGTEPKVHSVAVDDSFKPGHVMWVEKVNNDGTIYVSEYNHTPGEYSERTVPVEGLQFIYFNARNQ